MTSKTKISPKIWPCVREMLTFFGVKKPVFWTFCKLFRSCSEVVWVLLSVLKGQLLVVFLAWKLDV